MKKQVPLIVNLFITAMIVAGAAMCYGWLPGFVDYANGFLKVSSPVISIVSNCLAMPLFVILVLGYPFAAAIEKDAIFSAATAKRLKRIAVLLFAECGLFCAGVAALLCSGERLLAPVLGVVGLIGLMLAYVLLLLSRYVRQAAVLKEEVDATL